MSQKIASLYAEVSADTTKLQTGLKQAKGGLTQFGGSLNNVVQGVTGFSLAQIGLTGAIVGGINAAKKAVSEYSNYAERVDKLGITTGMATEEISRLVQVADDFRVDLGAMEGAMKMALQNGFEPTTENLAKLSDELKGMSSDTERAARAQEIFGRQWTNIMPLLDRGGDAIREASDNINDGLIITEDARQANRRYQEATDKLGDAWTSLSNTMAQEALPAITKVTEALANAIDASAQNQGELAGITGGYGRAAAAAMKNARALEYNADGDRLAAQAAAYFAETQEKQVIPAVDNTTSSVERYQTAINSANYGLEQASNQADRMASASSNLAGAVSDLQAAQANWKEGAGGEMAGLLNENWLGAAKYEEGLKIIDEAQGTNLYSAEKLRDAQEALAYKFNSGQISGEKFKEELIKINDTFMPLDESIKSSTDLMESLLAKLREFERTWTAQVRVDAANAVGSTVYGGGQGGGGQTNGGNTVLPTGLTDYGGKMASGGPVMAGTTYLVGENGPELYTPKRSGEIIPNGSFGNTYNLTIITSQSPQVVQTGYAIMQAMGGI